MTNKFIRIVSVIAAFSCVAGSNMSVQAASKAEKNRAKIDKNEKESLNRLYKEQPSAKTLVDQAYGYAVFHNSQTAFMISGGSGSGVAIDRKSGDRKYMKMASAGAGVGFGYQQMDVVFVFESAGKFKDFVDKGWDADSSASAAAATGGVNKGASFKDGLAIFQMTDKGLIAQASLKGTKYWKDDKLNEEKK